LIISGPGVPGNQRRKESVLIADLYPTILDFLDIEIPDTCHSKSLTGTFKEETRIRESLHLRYRNHIAGLKKDGFKLIKYFLETEDRYSLFDLNEDPGELRDLADDSQFSDIRSILQKELEDNWKTLEL